MAVGKSWLAGCDDDAGVLLLLATWLTAGRVGDKEKNNNSIWIFAQRTAE